MLLKVSKTVNPKRKVYRKIDFMTYLIDLILSKYKGLKFAELGQIVGCTEGAAKVRVHRALKELRTIFLELELQ